jgi:tetratricopeptide (TPR) repeat protein
LPLAEEALALSAHTGDGQRVVALTNAAQLRKLTGDVAGALAAVGEALPLAERIYGRDHVRTLGLSIDRATYLQMARDLPAARAAITEAADRTEGAYGPDHPLTGTALHRRAVILIATGELELALPTADRALAVLTRTDDRHGTYALLHNLCSGLIATDRQDAAEAMCVRSLAAARAFGTEQDTALETVQLADLLLERHDAAGAEPRYREAITAATHALGAGHLYTTVAHNGLGRALLMLGRPREAIPELEAVLAALAGGSPDPTFVPMARFTLAQARWAAGEHAAALAEARKALALYAAFEAPPELVAEVKTWMAHPH